MGNIVLASCSVFEQQSHFTLVYCLKVARFVHSLSALFHQHPSINSAAFSAQLYLFNTSPSHHIFTMKATILALFVAAAAAAPQNSAASETTTALTPTQSCLNECVPSDVNCQAICVGVPHPGEAQMGLVTDCVANCDQGDGSTAASEAYGRCRHCCSRRCIHHGTNPRRLPDRCCCVRFSNLCRFRRRGRSFVWCFCRFRRCLICCSFWLSRCLRVWQRCHRLGERWCIQRFFRSCPCRSRSVVRASKTFEEMKMQDVWDTHM